MGLLGRLGEVRAMYSSKLCIFDLRHVSDFLIGLMSTNVVF